MKGELFIKGNFRKVIVRFVKARQFAWEVIEVLYYNLRSFFKYEM